MKKKRSTGSPSSSSTSSTSDSSSSSSSSGDESESDSEGEKKRMKLELEKKLLKKYQSEISELVTHSEHLVAELAKERKKQKQLRKELEENKKKRKKKKRENDVTIVDRILKKKEKNRKKLKSMLAEKLDESAIELKKPHKGTKEALSLKQKMEQKLNAARFRFLNEQIYTMDSKEAKKIFEQDPDAFRVYHEGYRQQVKQWPLNPLDVVIQTIKRMPKSLVVADFGCGEGRLAKSVPQRTFSFDLVALADHVTPCDMAHVPLHETCIDVAVFCLSLMSTNLGDYLLEANRVLVVGGTLKIVEVVSRFERPEDFIKAVQYFGFKLMWKDLTHDYFYFMDFKKITILRIRPNCRSSNYTYSLVCTRRDSL
ncbi:unnamed protein product [Acanthoscelides obtectus]|nr:unnamed protein product [Acanthoscelides obtectus]CAK1660082.1 Ribosomal RNA-processing protein 8 [Acanthoscelides obtectus]